MLQLIIFLGSASGFLNWTAQKLIKDTVYIPTAALHLDTITYKHVVVLPHVSALFRHL